MTDPFKEQVSVLFAFKDDESACSRSSGRSIDYAGKVCLRAGDCLYANGCRKMFIILKYTVGRHDFLLKPCSQEMFESLYLHGGGNPPCFENLQLAFAPFGT